MRTLLLFFFIMIDLAANCQIFDLGDSSIKGGNVRFILEKSNGYKDDWREYSFDSLSRIIEIKYFRDKELLENDYRRYRMINDSVLLVTETIKNKRGVSVYNSKYYYDSHKRIVRYEYYKDGRITPMIVELNAEYKNERLIQYDRILIPNDTSVVEHYKIEYLNNKIIVKQTDNKEISHFTTTIKLDNNGNWIDRIVDYDDPECVLGGIKAYSPFRHDKYEIKYKYDKMGNWIQSYWVTLFGRNKRYKREIEYN